MKHIFFFILISINLFDSFSQNGKKRCGIDFPVSVCESEEPNGDVTLTWKMPSDPQGVFLKYELFSKESPYVPFTTINSISTTSYTISNTFKDNNFYLVTSTLCNSISEKFYSDTNHITNLESVKVEEGIEQLTWEKNPKNTLDSIYIERKTEFGNWKRIDSLLYNQKTYLDTVDICNKNLLFYRIGIKKNGCTSYSTVISDTLKDTYHPTIPKVVAVGFDTSNQNLIISWNRTRERDIQGYIIYQENNGLSTELATILNQANKNDTSYIIYNPSTTTISNYRIAAFDYCYSIAPKFQTSAQSQSFFTTLLNYQYDVCSKEINLNWNKIITTDEIKQYKLFIKKNNIWKCIDSTKNSTFKYTLEKFTNNTITIETETTNGYKFFTNTCNVFSKSPSEPKVSYTNYASVNENNVEIKHTISITPGLKELALFKLNNQNEFVEIEKKIANQTEIFFKDLDVTPTKFSYQYYIQHIDSCGTYTKKHLIQKTILLKENFINQDSLTTSAIFNNYLGFTGGVNKYSIECSIDDSEFKTINEVFSESLNQINYKVENIDSFRGKICFKIKGIENHNIYNSENISYSNPVCFYFNPRIFVPNAFTPEGKNPVFIPIISFANIDNYEFTIFNRWGEPVFYTKNINEGWDGTYGNEKTSNGLFIYLIKINSGSDKEIIKRGLINLIR